MNKSLQLIQKIKENMPYLGQYNDYSTKEYDPDAAEYMAPLADLQRPDYSGSPDKIQTKLMMRKSKGEDGRGDKVN